MHLGHWICGIYVGYSNGFCICLLWTSVGIIRITKRLLAMLLVWWIFYLCDALYSFTCTVPCCILFLICQNLSCHKYFDVSSLKTYSEILYALSKLYKLFVCVFTELPFSLTLTLIYFLLSLCFLSDLFTFLLVYFPTYLSTPSRIDRSVSRSEVVGSDQTWL